jgi:hypothetical protein
MVNINLQIKKIVFYFREFQRPKKKDGNVSERKHRKNDKKRERKKQNLIVSLVYFKPSFHF